MKPSYRWRLKIGSGSYSTVHPTWGKDLAVTTEQESDEMFFRDKLAGRLTFQLADFDAIHAAAFDTEFRLLLQKQNASNNWDTQSPAMRFYKTDCRFDLDHRRVEVQTETVDAYDPILSGINKEFNLIDLEPPTTPITYKRQAVLQVVFPGAEFMANFTDGMFWESPVSAPLIGADQTAESTNHDTMRNDYGFGVYDNGGIFDWERMVVTGTGGAATVAGTYDRDSYGVNGFPTGNYTRLDNAYTIGQYAVTGGFRLELRAFGSGTAIYASPISADDNILVAPFHDGITLTNISTPSLQVELFIFRPYVRLLTKETSVGGDPTTELPENDPFNPGVFTHALPISTANFIYSDDTGTTATRWGKVDDDALNYAGEYFNRPASPNGSTVMPVCNTIWKGASAWFYYDDTLRGLAEEAGETITIQDAYKLSDVINVLLEAVGSTANHQDGVAWSKFLYDTTNIIRGSRKVPVIVPKSNVLIGNYDQPAQKAPIRLAEVLQLLRFFHNAYWYVSSENLFIVEHYQYFHDGESYAGPNVGADITGLLHARTNKPWAHLTSVWNYEKQSLPERIEWSWMDDVSRPFEGYPININSGFVQKGNIQQNQIARFTSDVDYLHVAPGTVTTDGFVFFECTETGPGGALEVPFVEITISTEESYKIQNGYAANIYGHTQYWKHGLPASDVTINDQADTAESVVRPKKQDIVVPETDAFSPYELITTKLGDGRAESIELNLSDRSRKITIKLDA